VPADSPTADSSSSESPKASKAASSNTASPATVSAGDLPTRDELTLAWGDDVLDLLPNKAKAFFKAGRFVEVRGDHADFALPSKIHAERCEPHRPAVEKALAVHFGRPVPLRLVVDRETPQPDAPPDDAASPPEPDPVDEVGPIDELRDANDLEDTHLERITAAFPGAEIVADDTE
jgi:hypothetical protein